MKMVRISLWNGKILGLCAAQRSPERPGKPQKSMNKTSQSLDSGSLEKSWSLFEPEKLKTKGLNSKILYMSSPWVKIEEGHRCFGLQHQHFMFGIPNYLTRAPITKQHVKKGKQGVSISTSQCLSQNPFGHALTYIWLGKKNHSAAFHLSPGSHGVSWDPLGPGTPRSKANSLLSFITNLEEPIHWTVASHV